MISGENLTFCAADSNMYIGRIHPLIYCSSFFFPHSAFNFRNSHPCINLHFYRISLIYAWRAERVVLKNVRMFFLSGILEEMLLPCHWKEKKELKESRKREGLRWSKQAVEMREGKRRPRRWGRWLRWGNQVEGERTGAWNLQSGVLCPF